MVKDVDMLIRDIPYYIKEKTNLDLLLSKLEKAKDRDKLDIIKDINKELELLLEGKLDIELSAEDKKRLEEIKQYLDKVKVSLDNLKEQIGSNLSSGYKRLQNYKIFLISSDIEKEGLDGKDDKGFLGFFRSILKWFDNIIGSFLISEEKIAVTFEKLGYGDRKDIEEVIKLIGNIKYKDLKEFYENLENDKDLTIYINKVEYNDNPLIPNFIEKYTDKFINLIKDFFRGKVEFKNIKQKKIAAYIIMTLLLNKDFFKQSNSIISKLKLFSNSRRKMDNLTVVDLLAMMFPHGLSDLLRDYALPAKGVKLFKL